MNDKYVLLIASIILFIILIIFKAITNFLVKYIKKERLSYNVNIYLKTFFNIVYILMLFILWAPYLRSIITFISLFSAGFVFAIREIILNLFCGLYIRFSKPFKVEDRIEINGLKGDVIGASLWGFDVLEVSNKYENGQSTGVVVHFPNSIVVKEPIKNNTKVFKYIWNELEIKIKLSSDLKKNKREIYKIINNIEVVKRIPNKMKNAINKVNTTYRVYYNNYEPIIYTKVTDEYVLLSLRYLIHPKKARYVESVIWNKIYESFLEGNIDLYDANEN